MPLYQNSVLEKYLKQQDSEVVAKAYKKYIKYFHNPDRQKNIREIKEEGFQQKFLIELFVNVFDYIINPDPKYNLTTEFKNEKGAKKADGAIIKENKALGVIELKGTKTKDLEKIRRQAFDYKANHTGCVYVITSNFEKLRFYINNAVEFEEFNLFALSEDRFRLLYLCLAKDNILKNIPLSIKESSIQQEKEITDNLYADYSLFKRELFRDLVKRNMKNNVFLTELNNEDAERGAKNIKRTLFKKSQKLIDRFLFIFFAEDSTLLTSNSTKKILNKWDSDNDFGDERPLYNLFKQYFHFLDTGRKGTGSRAEIFAYNGGLFKPDPVLDSLLIDSNLLYKHIDVLQTYDFKSQVDVNILGHIFENSLNEIESINAEIEGIKFDKQKTKRKKDGVFYTPKYITKYIVDNTVGKLCNEKKTELKLFEEEFRPKRQKETKKKLLAVLEMYRQWLLQLAILDPACGSGAFLNQALDFLIKEHQFLDVLQTNLLGGSFVFPNIENTVLENNIFGVDLNEESVEIAKLSLWLRTAQPRRKLNDLSSNIKCGNSLIDSKAVAGKKAFKWEEEFPNVFPKEPKQLYLVTFVTHNSRISDRMVQFNPPEFIDELQPFFLQEEDYLKMIDLIGEGIKKYQIPTVSFTVLPDHVHLLCAAQNEIDLSEQIRKLKGFTSYQFQRYKNWKKGEKKVWAQKFNRKLVEATTNHVGNVVNYITGNLKKHSERWGETLMDNGLKPIAELNNKICISYQDAITNKYGFDVVIGNPPYVSFQNIDKEEKYELTRLYKSASGKFDLYVVFLEKGISLLIEDGTISYIMPNKFMLSNYGEGIKGIILKKRIIEIADFKDQQLFDGATTYPCIITIENSALVSRFIYTKVLKELQEVKGVNYLIDATLLNTSGWHLGDNKEKGILDKILQFDPIKAISKAITQGLRTGKLEIFFNNINKSLINELNLEPRIIQKCYTGKNVKKFGSKLNNDEDLLIYPYENGKPADINEFPNIKQYLLQEESALLNRKDSGKIFKDTDKLWYEYWDSKTITLESPKIVFPDISKVNNFYLDTEGIPFLNTCYSIFLKDKDLYLPVISILNSKLFYFYIKRVSPSVSGGYFRYKTGYVEKFGIPVLTNDFNVNSRTLATEIIAETKRYFEMTLLFENYLKSQLTTHKLPKKLQSWHILDFGDFIKELNKAIKNENKQRMNKGINPLEIKKLSKIDEMEWMEIFETKKAEAQKLKFEINKTDVEINALVYELYGLTQDEIKIVEKS